MSEKKSPNDDKSSPEKEPKPPEELMVETKHSISINGEEIKYKAVAGTIIIKESGPRDKEEEHKPKATMFYVAYTKDDADHQSRPITFSFNGGPGSSSVWMHLGLLGPRKVVVDDFGNAPKPPYKLEDNLYSLLDKTDLVFIDPVSTGFSRAVEGEKSIQFHEFKKDIQSVGDFIHQYVTRFKRWASPKFLIGESYGTTRGAGLSGYLHERHGMYLNGIMLISSILNFQTARFDIGNDLPFILFLPTYTATAWYHNRLSPELQEDLYKTLAQVEDFAIGEYASALMLGDSLNDEARQNIVSKLAAFSGLSETYIEQTNLRINIFRFTKELLRNQRLTVGRIDSRYTATDYDAAGERFEFDPSMAAIMGVYTGTFNDYIRGELEFETDLPYEILANRVWPWNYDKFQNHYLNVAETLRKVIATNPYLKVFVANGFFDLATPYMATNYTFSHLGLEPQYRDNISMKYYEAGHMMYAHRPSLEAIKNDLAKFIDSAL